jgi:hypothetical protein
MWARALLLFLFWLVVFRLLFRLIRAVLGPPRDRAPEKGESETSRRTAGRTAPPPWRQADVIDVPFRESSEDNPESGARRAGP